MQEQLRVLVEMVKERQGHELVDDDDYGVLHSAAPHMRVSTRTGAPTPDDLDELIAEGWKEPAFFVAHPRATAAFGRECTRRRVPPPTATPALAATATIERDGRRARREHRREGSASVSATHTAWRRSATSCDFRYSGRVGHVEGEALERPRRLAASSSSRKTARQRDLRRPRSRAAFAGAPRRKLGRGVARRGEFPVPSVDAFSGTRSLALAPSVSRRVRRPPVRTSTLAAASTASAARAARTRRARRRPARAARRRST